MVLERTTLIINIALRRNTEKNYSFLFNNTKHFTLVNLSKPLKINFLKSPWKKYLADRTAISLIHTKKNQNWKSTHFLRLFRLFEAFEDGHSYKLHEKNWLPHLKFMTLYLRKKKQRASFWQKGTQLKMQLSQMGWNNQVYNTTRYLHKHRRWGLSLYYI